MPGVCGEPRYDCTKLRILLSWSQRRGIASRTYMNLDGRIRRFFEAQRDFYEKGIAQYLKIRAQVGVSPAMMRLRGRRVTAVNHSFSTLTSLSKL